MVRRTTRSEGRPHAVQTTLGHASVIARSASSSGNGARCAPPCLLRLQPPHVPGICPPAPLAIPRGVPEQVVIVSPPGDVQHVLVPRCEAVLCGVRDAAGLHPNDAIADDPPLFTQGLFKPAGDTLEGTVPEGIADVDEHRPRLTQHTRPPISRPGESCHILIGSLLLAYLTFNAVVSLPPSTAGTSRLDRRTRRG